MDAFLTDPVNFLTAQACGNLKIKITYSEFYLRATTTDQYNILLEETPTFLFYESAGFTTKLFSRLTGFTTTAITNTDWMYIATIWQYPRTVSINYINKNNGEYLLNFWLYSFL